MTESKNTLVAQLRGATRLAVEATRSVTDLVQTMHHTIGAGPETLGRPLERATKVLTAPTYGTIRGVTSAVGGGLDLALSTLEPLVDRAGDEAGPIRAALNGVMGDYLEATNNPLAIEMRLCRQGAPLTLTSEALAREFPVGRQLLVLVHGSSNDETSWSREDHDHGAALAKDCGFAALYLRYNTGRHVSQNGRDFAALLEQTVHAWPRPVDGVVLLGHSMGGLVLRSACAVGEAHGHAWRSKLRVLVTLGTPHHGAPLERAGNWIDALLNLSRYSAPLGRLGQLRSAGVTDLRYGNVRDADWQGRDRFAKAGDRRVPLHLPADVKCFAVAATSAPSPMADPPGDGLVPVDSALGIHSDPARQLGFTPAHRFLALGANHSDLLHRQDVYAQLRTWLSSESTRSPQTPVG